MSENALVRMADREIPTVRETMDGLWDSLEKSAAVSIRQAADEGGVELSNYSAIEQRALLFGEMLNISKGLSFAEMVVQGRIISTMERESLYAAHPGGYRTLDELARDQGISASELSNVKDLTQIIFPWVQENLQLEPIALWQEVGKSNLREMTPLLKRIITGEEARGSVEASYTALANDIAATAQAAGETLTDEQVQRHAVDQLINHGMTMTNADLRQTIRPERTPSLEPVIIRRFHDGNRGSNVYVLFRVNEDQMTLLQRRLHGYWDPVRATASSEADVRSIRLVRQLVDGQ